LPQKKRIGLFGGTFDPVHLGHTVIAEWLQFKLDLDVVYFIPNYIHPFAKRNDILDPEHRLIMLELALSDYPTIKICNYEIEKKGISYSIDTIRHFGEQYPGAKLYYLIGGDNINDFNRWKEADEIFNLASVVVYNRMVKNGEASNKFEYLDSPLIGISSSQIRDHIKRGLPYRSFLHPDVCQYIDQKMIYRSV